MGACASAPTRPAAEAAALPHKDQRITLETDALALPAPPANPPPPPRCGGDPSAGLPAPGSDRPLRPPPLPPPGLVGFGQPPAASRSLKFDATLAALPEGRRASGPPTDPDAPSRQSSVIGSALQRTATSLPPPPPSPLSSAGDSAALSLASSPSLAAPGSPSAPPPTAVVVVRPSSSLSPRPRAPKAPTTLAAFLAAKAAASAAPHPPPPSALPRPQSAASLPDDDRPTFLRDALDGGGSGGSSSSRAPSTAAAASPPPSSPSSPTRRAASSSHHHLGGAAATSLASAAAAVAYRPRGVAVAPASPPGDSIAGWQALAAELGVEDGDGGEAVAALPPPPPPRAPPPAAPPLLPSLFAPGGLFFLQFESLKPLGRGAFGSAVLVRRRADGARLVAKVVRGGGGRGGGRGGGGDPASEAAALAGLDHPHILRYVASFSLGPDGSAAILTEHCGGGDLGTALAARSGRPLEARAALRLVAQLARALAHCHARGLAHRDVKPANVFLDGRAACCVKLGDFGLATDVTSDPSSSPASAATAVVGTPLYHAPEVVAGAPGCSGPPADVWALGLVLYECLSGGRPAFGGGHSPGAVGAAILAGRRAPLPPPTDRLGRVARDLIDALLAPSPAERPSAAALLAHPAVAAAAAAVEAERARRAGGGGKGGGAVAGGGPGPACVAALAALRGACSSSSG